MSNEQTQEPKCPIGGDKTSAEDKKKPIGIDESFQPVFLSLMAVLAETIDEEQREQFIKEAGTPDSPFYHVLRGAYLAGFHYAIHIPAVVAVGEFTMWKLKATQPKADELMAKMKEALASRPDQPENTHAE